MKHILFLFTAGLILISCSPKEHSAKALRSVMAEALESGVHESPAVVAAVASISKVGATDQPIGVLLSHHPQGLYYTDDYNDIERMPVFPGGIMQTATLLYYLGNGKMRLDDSIATNHGLLPEFDVWPSYRLNDPHILDYERETGRDSISIRRGFLHAIAQVTDRYVLDELTSNPWDKSAFKGYMEKLENYLGTSPAYFLPPYNYQGVLKRTAVSIADGTGVLLSQSQILRLYGAIANNGIMPRKAFHRKVSVCSEAVAKEIAALLRENILEGTGALLKDCEVPVAGKTGNGRLDKGFIQGYGNVEDRGPIGTSTFVGFFPYGNPEYTLCVTIYFDGKFGHSISQRVFKSIVNQMNKENLLSNIPVQRN